VGPKVSLDALERTRSKPGIQPVAHRYADNKNGESVAISKNSLQQSVGPHWNSVLRRVFPLHDPQFLFI
jgi:hypothetical protein